MGLREKQMADRRQRILDAADVLIRTSGGTEFSMRSLAAAAEVSPATPYNLFGSKEGVLSSLLSNSLDGTMSEGLLSKSDNPLDFIISSTEIAVDILVRDQALLRPLYQYLLGVVDPIHRPTHIKRSLHFWRVVAMTVSTRERPDGSAVETIDFESFSYVLLSHFVGLLDLWIHEDIDDEAFRIRAVYGGIVIVSSLIPKESAKDMDARLRTARQELRKITPAPSRKRVRTQSD